MTKVYYTVVRAPSFGYDDYTVKLYLDGEEYHGSTLREAKQAARQSAAAQLNLEVERVKLTRMAE